eukprot:2864620-Pleurochrysis_carterae.AAC.1
MGDANELFRLSRAANRGFHPWPRPSRRFPYSTHEEVKFRRKSEILLNNDIYQLALRKLLLRTSITYEQKTVVPSPSHSPHRWEPARSTLPVMRNFGKGFPAPTASKDAVVLGSAANLHLQYLSLSQTEAAGRPGCYFSRGKPRAECLPGADVRGAEEPSAPALSAQVWETAVQCTATAVALRACCASA